jgi:hypothetical protein
MNVFTLLERASHRLQTPDAFLHEQADTVLGILRSSGVLPYKRSSINGALHKLVSSILVEAYDQNTTVDVATRRAGTFHRYGYSTKIVEYLDAMVQQGFLLSDTGKAKGRLHLSDLIETYLDQPYTLQA